MKTIETFTLPPLGCFAILGNHDYGEHCSDSNLADKLTKRLSDLGVQVLRNASRTVSGLAIAGLDDSWGTNFHPSGVLPCLDPAARAIVLCHNPDAAERKVWGDFQGWILSGHTRTAGNASRRSSRHRCCRSKIGGTRPASSISATGGPSTSTADSAICYESASTSGRRLHSSASGSPEHGQAVAFGGKTISPVLIPWYKQ